MHWFLHGRIGEVPVEGHGGNIQMEATIRMNSNEIVPPKPSIPQAIILQEPSQNSPDTPGLRSPKLCKGDISFILLLLDRTVLHQFGRKQLPVDLT